jgi:hypothetical protein
MISREHSDSMDRLHAERRDDAYASVLRDEIEANRSRCISTMTALDAAELACDDEFAQLLAREDATPNEVGRWILSARNAWAARCAEFGVM